MPVRYLRQNGRNTVFSDLCFCVEAFKTFLQYPYYDNTDSNSTDEIYEKGVRPDVSQDSSVQVSNRFYTVN